MPLGRYFAFIGGSLLALIFLIDWLVPDRTIAAPGGDVDRAVIRIHSAHKWPSAVVFDTTQPTISAPPQPVLAQAAAEKPRVAQRSPHDALALAADVPAAATAHPAPVKHVKRRVRAPRPPAEQVASYETFGFRPLFVTGW
jgi:hypothetical protein